MTLDARRLSLSTEDTAACAGANRAILVLMRHGESEGNRRNVFTGWLDLPLTDHGRAEARSAAISLKQAGITIDRIYSSDLARARESAEIVADRLGNTVEPEACIALKERSYGLLEGRRRDDVFRELGHDRVQRWRRSYAEPPPGGESLEQMLARVRPFFEREIEPLLAAGRSVMVVAHGSSLRALIVMIEGRVPERIGDVEIATGEVLCYCIASTDGDPDTFRPS